MNIKHGDIQPNKIGQFNDEFKLIDNFSKMSILK